MDEDALDFRFARDAQKREKMIDVGVDAAVAEQAHDVELVRACALESFGEKRLLGEVAVGEKHFDARDVHLHDAAGADVEVADFGVAHLAFGEADARAGGLDERVGKFLQEAVVVRLASQGDGVAGGFGAVTPAVEHGEDDGFGCE